MIQKLINLKLTKSQQHIVNISAGVINMFVTTMISFFLSPYIVRTIGVEANGFVSLANSFITYMTLARTALNSMASRFLMIAYYNNEKEKFERYYSSLFFADLILGAAFGIIGGICVIYLDSLLSIPKELVFDVKLLFSLLFLNFAIATIITVWNTTTYITNKLYLDSITSALNAVIRIVVILGMFLCLTPSVYYVGVGTLAGGLVGYTLRFFYKKNLFPNLRARIQNFSWTAIWELISSGIWNSISSLGSILIESLDLLVTNLFIGATAMGTLSLAKTMPAFISSLISTIAAVFIPTLIIDYAKENKEGIIKTINQSSKLISVICSVPLGFLMVYGKEFYTLWQPSQDARIIHILAIITIFGRVFFTGAEPLFHVFTVTNKVKQNATVTLVNGMLSITLTFFFVKYTSLGVFAVAGVSVVCCFFKNMLFVIPYSAKYLGLKKTTFYNTVWYSILCVGILYIWGYLEKRILPGGTWIGLILAGVVFAVGGLVLTAGIMLNSAERRYLLDTIIKKVKK